MDVICVREYCQYNKDEVCNHECIKDNENCCATCVNFEGKACKFDGASVDIYCGCGNYQRDKGE